MIEEPGEPNKPRLPVVKTTELKDRNGNAIRVGSLVRATIQGTPGEYPVRKLRPRTSSVEVGHRGYRVYLPASWCEVVNGGAV